LNDPDATKPSVVTFSHRSKELRYYSLVQNLTVPPSNASPGWTVHILRDNDQGYSQRRLKGLSNGINFAS
jgi:hypothetical protein